MNETSSQVLVTSLLRVSTNHPGIIGRKFRTPEKENPPKRVDLNSIKTKAATSAAFAN